MFSTCMTFHTHHFTIQLTLYFVVVLKLHFTNLTMLTSLAYSATGTRTRVARVRAEYPNQLDYSGLVAASKIQILNCNQLGINSQSNAKRCLLEAAVHRSLHIFSYNVFNRQQFKSQKPPCIAATFCHWKIYGRPAQDVTKRIVCAFCASL